MVKLLYFEYTYVASSSSITLQWFNFRLTVVEDLAKASNKKLAQGMTELNKAMSAAKSDADKVEVVNYWLCTFYYIILYLKIRGLVIMHSTCYLEIRGFHLRMTNFIHAVTYCENVCFILNMVIDIVDISGFNFPFHLTESQKTKCECKTSLLQQYSNSSPGEWNFMWFWLLFLKCELCNLIIPHFLCVPQPSANLGGSHPI